MPERTTPLLNPLPARPRAVLRVGFAGRRQLSEAAEAYLRAALPRVFDGLGQGLIGLRAGPAAACYADEPPLLRLVTGLCEGADTIAAALLPVPEAAGPATELAAVLPFDLADYRASRPLDFLPEFDADAARCAYILALDGHAAKPDPDTGAARAARAKGYRAQSAVLLRQADLLLAAADPDAPGAAGGTLETVRAALAFGLPVVFVHLADGGVWLIDPADDLASALAGPPVPLASLETALAELVSGLLAPPALSVGDADGGAGAAGLGLLAEFFSVATVPPARPRPGRPEQIENRPTWRGRAWDWFHSHFAGDERLPGEAGLAPYTAWRERARRLNYYYSGLYRGAFVLNYALAVLAVLLASLSLVLIGASIDDVPHSGAAEQVIGIAAAAQGGHGPAWLLPVLLGLGGLKLVILIFIARNTRRANDGQWCDLAVNYRYLAERLRALYYLPQAGSFQPPALAAPQYASRALHQSAVDWLFAAINRAVPVSALTEPDGTPLARRETLPGTDHQVLVLRPCPTLALARLRAGWIAGQLAYHRKNTRTMGRIARFTERASRGLNLAVVGVVGLDIALVLLSLSPALPAALAARAHALSPWLMLLAAVLPAAVAAVNGLRFQSECERLAERSTTLVRLLRLRADEAERLATRLPATPGQPAHDPGAWTQDTLLLAERVAGDCAREVAEWSVVYAKALPET